MRFTELELNKATKIKALLLNVEEKRTKNNTLYLNMSLSDGETIISANLWDTAKENFAIERGNVVEAVIFVKIQKNSLYLHHFHLRKCLMIYIIFPHP